MRPIDSVTGKPWDAELANLKLQDFKHEAEADLLRLDERRSGGRLNAENGYSALYLDGPEPEDPKQDRRRYRVSPELASMKHTGQDSRQLREKRWAEFCSEPRDQDAYRTEIQQRQTQTVARTVIAAGQELEDQVAALADRPGGLTPKDSRQQGSKNRPKQLLES